MPTRINQITEKAIFLIGAPAGLTAEGFLTGVLYTAGIWLSAYVIYFFLRKPLVRKLKRIFTGDFLKKILSEKTVNDCCDEDHKEL